MECAVGDPMLLCCKERFPPGWCACVPVSPSSTSSMASLRMVCARDSGECVMAACGQLAIDRRVLARQERGVVWW